MTIDNRLPSNEVTEDCVKDGRFAYRTICLLSKSRMCPLQGERVLIDERKGYYHCNKWMDKAVLIVRPVKPYGQVDSAGQ